MIDPGIVDEVRALIETAPGGAADSDGFTSLALAVAASQGRLVGDRPSTGRRQGLDLIDPLPETAFKMMTVAMFSPSEAVAEFLTSGTSSGTRGRLLVKDMDLYRSSVVAGFRMFCMTGTPPRRFLSLIPPADARPSSSLSWMASFVMREFDSGQGMFAAADGRLDGEAILRALADSGASGEPLFILGTSVDFMTLYEFLESVPGRPLPAPGCRVMHTGGAKASGREITRPELIARARDLFLAEPEDVIEEFGMTELFSQAYDSPRATPGPRRLVPVPWMKTRVLDPRTLNDVAEGERGILVHYDLANVHTCVAMMAADTAVRIRDGFCDITRSIGAPARGCSSEAASGVRTGEGGQHG